jgi:hypothetical protein
VSKTAKTAKTELPQQHPAWQGPSLHCTAPPFTQL